MKRAKQNRRFTQSRLGKALIDAIRFGDTQLALSLLSAGADPNSSDGKRRSALWHAAYWVREPVIRALVRRGATLPSDVLIGPAHEGAESIVRFLIRAGADVNCWAGYTRYNVHGGPGMVESPLNAAILGILIHPSCEQVALQLIKAGAVVNGPGFNHPSAGNHLSIAARVGREKIVRAMIKAGARLEEGSGPFGGTALHDACRFGNYTVAKILINAGAALEATDDEGQSPASLLESAGRLDLTLLSKQVGKKQRFEASAHQID